jgi:hypothetical protein
MPSKAVVKHLKLAKRDIAAGTASFRSAANHIAAAVKAGATQQEAAALVGRSQSWVNRLPKWREGGFKADSPFAEDHARAIISGANNPAQEAALTITHQPGERRTVTITPEMITRGGEPLGEVRRGYDFGEVTRGNETRLPLSVLRELEQLEKLARDFSVKVLQIGGISAQAKRRFSALADVFLALNEQKAAVTLDAPQDSALH